MCKKIKMRTAFIKTWWLLCIISLNQPAVASENPNQEWWFDSIGDYLSEMLPSPFWGIGPQEAVCQTDTRRSFVATSDFPGESLSVDVRFVDPCPTTRTSKPRLSKKKTCFSRQITPICSGCRHKKGCHYNSLNREQVLPRLEKDDEEFHEPNLDPDSRVPVYELATGRTVCGAAAPSRRKLELWLENNPGWIVAPPKTAPPKWVRLLFDDGLLQ
jgi:BRK domain